jgi:hypothetical protein
MKNKVNPDLVDFMRELFFGNKTDLELIADAEILAEKSDEIAEIDFIMILINTEAGMEAESVDEAKRFAIAWMLERI